MNHFIQKETKCAYLIPKKDVRHLCPTDIEVLKYIIHKIDYYRQQKNQPPLSLNKYIVCNRDEPYADDVWDVILNGERQKLIAGDPVVRKNIDKELEAVLSKFPCPFCSNDEMFLEGGYTFKPQIKDKVNRYFVSCPVCGHQTEWVPSPMKAVELWCTRNGKKADIEKLLKKPVMA